MIMAVLEGVAMCFVLLIICVVGIANGPVGMVFFYEKEVQQTDRSVWSSFMKKKYRIKL